MARSMQKQNISYRKITPYTLLRGIDYVGVSYAGSELDALIDNCDFDALVERYFGPRQAGKLQEQRCFFVPLQKKGGRIFYPSSF
jgi:hypothetical protein